MAATISGATICDVYDRLHGIDAYNPMEADTFADWSTEAGDIVTMKRGEDEYAVPLHSTRMVWKGAPQMTLSSTGNKQRESLAKVSKQKYSRGSGGMRGSQEIHQAIYSDDGYLHAYIDVTASSIRTEVGQTISGMAHSIIEQTATFIRSEVANAASSISHTVIEQTAEYVRTEVAAVASGVAYTVIMQTMTGIEQKVARRARVFAQWTDPSTQHDDLMDGDIWFKIPNNTTWGEVASGSWADLNGIAWKDLFGVQHYVWRNGAWKLVTDTSTIVESAVEIEHDKEHWAVVAHQVDLMGEAYDSNLNVTAKKISAEVTAAKGELSSAIAQTATSITAQIVDLRNDTNSKITQTASSIRLEVNASKSQLFSTIEQTATQIRLEVANTISDVRSSITQTSESITLQVSAAKSTLYSSIEQTATQIRAEIWNVEEGLQSSITQTASAIRLEVANTISDVRSSITQTATSIELSVSSAKSSLWSGIMQTSTQISLKVSKDGVISSINQTAESITINASKINLSGYVTTSTLASNIASISNINIQQLTSERGGINVYSVATTSYTQGDVSCYVPHAIWALQIVQSGNTYKLQRKRFSEDEWIDVGSFSRAVGSWSVGGGSGNVNVTANPQSQTKSVPVSIGGSNSITSNGTYIYKVYYEDASGDDQETGSSMNVTVNVPSGDYNTGYNAGGQTAYVYPTVYTENKSGYTIDSEITIPAGQTRYIVAVYTNLGGNAQWGAAKSMKVTASNPYPQTKTFTCIKAQGGSQWTYEFRWTDNGTNPQKFVAGNTYKFHNNSGYS